jgi:peptidoglycan/LPS O-acetylase OafA/YrhL
VLAATAAALTLFMIGYAEFVMPAAGAYLLFWFGTNREIPLHNWGKYGDFSYGLYVFGWPVQQTVIHFMGAKIHPLMLFAISFAITTVFAVASWYCVERPFLRMKKKPVAKPVAVPLGDAADAATVRASA